MRLLDLFCGAGGCAVGYSRAGFTEIVGVDNRPQPRYPFAFVHDDVMDIMRHLLGGWSVRDVVGTRFKLTDFDAVHASPPCDEYSAANRYRHCGRHPDLLGPVRELLRRSGRPWVIENVPGAPLKLPAMLCGTMFGLRVIRHRLFESSVGLTTPLHPTHRNLAGSHRGRSGQDRSRCSYVTVTSGGNGVKLAERRAAMGIDWMNWDELADAIPPAYTEFVGRQLIDHIRHAQEAA